MTSLYHHPRLRFLLPFIVFLACTHLASGQRTAPATPAPPDTRDPRQKELGDHIAREISRYFTLLPNCKFTYRSVFHNANPGDPPRSESLVEFCKFDTTYYHKLHSLTYKNRIMTAFDGATYIKLSASEKAPWVGFIGKDFSNVGSHFKGSFEDNPLSAAFFHLVASNEDTRNRDMRELRSEEFWREAMSRVTVQITGAGSASPVYTYVRKYIYKAPKGYNFPTTHWNYTLRCVPGSMMPEYIQWTSQVPGESPKAGDPPAEREWKVTKWFTTPRDSRGRQMRIPSQVVEGPVGQAKSEKPLSNSLWTTIQEETFELLDAAPPQSDFWPPLQEIRNLWDLDRNMAAVPKK